MWLRDSEGAEKICSDCSYIRLQQKYKDSAFLKLSTVITSVTELKAELINAIFWSTNYNFHQTFTKRQLKREPKSDMVKGKDVYIQDATI